MDQGSSQYGHSVPSVASFAAASTGAALFDDPATALSTAPARDQQYQQHTYQQQQHSQHASTSQQPVDVGYDEHSAAAVGDDDHDARLSNARMSKKPKPRQPAPAGVIVTDKSCVRCRVRKGAPRLPSARVLVASHRRKLTICSFCAQCGAIGSSPSVTTARRGARTATSRTGGPSQRSSRPTRLVSLRLRNGSVRPCSLPRSCMSSH